MTGEPGELLEWYVLVLGGADRGAYPRIWEALQHLNSAVPEARDASILLRVSENDRARTRVNGTNPDTLAKLRAWLAAELVRAVQQ
jgi:hypothetical protein